MQTIFNLLVFILIFGSIISIHEFGHLLMAKHFGVLCPKYSIGFGPVLLHKEYHGTDYELRAFPLGGFVMMAGEDDTEYENVNPSQLLNNKRWYQKVLIFLAGVLSNFITAIIVMIIVFSCSNIMPTNSNVIGGFSENSILQNAGLKVGDEITCIYVEENNKTYNIEHFDDITLNTSTIGSYNSIHTTITYIRDNKDYKVKCTIKYDNDSSKYLLGISEKTVRPSISYAITYTFKEFVFLATYIIKSFINLFTHFFSTVKDYSGPVGIYKETATITESGDISMIFYFWSLLCINIGVFNLFPIPGLDGYQVLVTLLETIIHKKIPDNFKQYLTLLGFSFMILLTLIITFNDIF